MSAEGPPQSIQTPGTSLKEPVPPKAALESTAGPGATTAGTTSPYEADTGGTPSGPETGQTGTSTQAETGDAGIDSNVKRPEPETPINTEPTREQIQQQIDEAWGANENSATYQVINSDREGFWSSDQAAIDNYLKAHNIPVDDNSRATEKARRESIHQVAEQLRLVDEVTGHPDADFTYDETSATYTLHPGKDNETKVKLGKTLIDTVLDAENDLASETSKPERAARAKSNLQVLNKYRGEDGSGFEVKTNEELKAKELKELGVKTSDLAIDRLDAALTEYGQEIPRIKEEKDNGKIDLEALKKIFPEGQFTRIAVLLNSYSNLDMANKPDLPPENQARLENSREIITASLLSELQSLPDSTPVQNHKQELVKLRAAGQELLGGKLNQLNEASRNMAADVLGVDPGNIQLGNEEVLSCLTTALMLKDHAGMVAGELRFDEQGQKIIDHLVSKGAITKKQTLVIAALAAREDFPQKFTDELDIDLQIFEGSKDPKQGVGHQAQKVVELMDKRRADTKKPQLTEKEKTNYITASTEMIKDDVKNLAEGNNLVKWLMAAGILGTIVIPKLQQGADEAGAEQQR